MKQVKIKKNVSYLFTWRCETCGEFNTVEESEDIACGQCGEWENDPERIEDVYYSFECPECHQDNQFEWCDDGSTKICERCLKSFEADKGDE